MLLLGNWGQQMDIEDHRREIAALREQVRSSAGNRATADLSRRMDEIERENDVLRLYLAALVRYLGAKRLLKKEEFAALVDAVDAEDGTRDGGYEGKIVR
jgi:hypothetical protein